MTALAFRDDTAVLHALCRGPKLKQAISWLMNHPDPQVQICGRQLREEFFRMGARVREENVSEADRQAWSEAYQAFEDALLDRGRKEGRKEGAVASSLRMCLKIWRRRFGEPAPWVAFRLQHCDSPELLEELADIALTGELAQAEAAVAARLGNGR